MLIKKYLKDAKCSPTKNWLAIVCLLYGFTNIVRYMGY